MVAKAANCSVSISYVTAFPELQCSVLNNGRACLKPCTNMRGGCVAIVDYISSVASTFQLTHAIHVAN